MKYFRHMYEKAGINEVYEGISQPLSSQIETLKNTLDNPSQILLLDITKSIKEMEGKKKSSENLNISLVIVIVLSTLIGIIYSLFF